MNENADIKVKEATMSDLVGNITGILGEIENHLSEIEDKVVGQEERMSIGNMETDNTILDRLRFERNHATKILQMIIHIKERLW